MLNLKTQLCKNEKLLNLRTEDLKCTKYKLEEMEQMVSFIKVLNSNLIILISMFNHKN